MNWVIVNDNIYQVEETVVKFTNENSISCKGIYKYIKKDLSDVKGNQKVQNKVLI